MIDKTPDRRVEIDFSTRADWGSPTGPAADCAGASVVTLDPN
jgi:hypothetical protein